MHMGRNLSHEVSVAPSNIMKLRACQTAEGPHYRIENFLFCPTVLLLNMSFSGIIVVLVKSEGVMGCAAGESGACVVMSCVPRVFEDGVITVELVRATGMWEDGVIKVELSCATEMWEDGVIRVELGVQQGWRKMV